MTIADLPQRLADEETRRDTLTHTLAIMQARSRDDLVARVLEAAVGVTGALSGVAQAPDGTCWTVGDEPDGVPCAPAAAVTVGESDHAIGPLYRTSTAVLSDIVIVLRHAGPGCHDTASGALLALVLEHGRVASDRLGEIEHLARRADSDPLTGLRHQRPFEARLSNSQPGRTAVLAFDVDDFKKINDVYGHQAGDEALLALVGALRAALRGDDQLYRIGGDEFAVVIDVNSVAETRSIARRLLDAARGVGHTVSVGAAIRLWGETGRETLLRADRALYEAKRAGRDTARIAA